MTIPVEKQGTPDEAYNEVMSITDEYNEGSITNGERYNKVVDVWSQTNEKLTKVMIEKISTQSFTSKEDKSSDRSNSAIFQLTIYDGRFWSEGFSCSDFSASWYEGSNGETIW